MVMGGGNSPGLRREDDVLCIVSISGECEK